MGQMSSPLEAKGWKISQCRKLIIIIHVQYTLGWPVPPFLSEDDSAGILSGDKCPQDYTTLKIICVASVLGVPQDTTFL